ncbi:hypothetical protein COT62_02765 [Candidatus Roizmanbacteria bacterium CG09_land_8_20_14_0_10_41_9]|uniref:Type II secretion system protein GspG C-terminal domain-containing protein n=1 Tax=Candidatus Roizmanbacteria bacterium CG09_land_8_20_14_0_10_41_9 TaxID=1974850 RepID=A0A2H0WSR5_9BACT|nr:MAG: hypothetical protein COT62_02765 [Candidatus Roizmanbacteria bacterium CG09_land_8_20_14_0_10_41_9]
MINNRGYTLLELIVVISIIALLIAGGVATYSQLMKQSRDGRRKADLENIRGALEMYRSNNGSYPAALSLLTGSPKYLQSVPADPRSPTYTYYYTGSSSDYTLGAYLESSTAGGCGVSCTGATCNYCVGPYGQ